MLDSIAMRAVMLLGCVLAAGCDRVLGFSIPPACPGPAVGGPEVDDDGDLISNADDNCPLASNPRQEDEDGDATGDACDLCAVGEEDRDADCDGVGDACDPDDTRPDARQFYGFASADGLKVLRGEISGGTLRVRRDVADGMHVGAALAQADVVQDGVYEARFDLLGFGTEPYATIELRFGVDPRTESRGYFAWVLYALGGTSQLVIGEFDSTLDPLEPYMGLVAATIDPITPGTYTFRVSVSGATARAELLGEAGTVEMLDAIDLLPVQHTPSRFGFVSNLVDLDVAYLTRTGPLL